MPATERETVGLNLTGDFASKAQVDAAAALQAAAALERLGGAAGSVKGTPKSAAEGVDDLTSRLKAAKHAADELRAQADRAFALGNKRRGDALEKSAEALDPLFNEEKDTASFFEKALDAGGEKAKGWIVGGATVAAAAIVAASTYLLEKGIELGVHQTAEREKQSRIFDKLTDGEGDIAYRVTMSLAGEKGVEPAEAALRVKGLIQAGFDKDETEILFRAAADLGAVKGDDKSKTFLELLEKTAAKGKVNEESLNGLAEAGLEASSVLGMLAQKGESLDAVRARVKAGAVSLTDFTKAVGGAVNEKLGGVAGGGLDAQLEHLKILGLGLFDDFDIKPLTTALDTVIQTLDSPTGAALKDAITDLGNAALDTFSVFKTESGKQSLKDFFDSAGQAAREVASVIREIKAEVQVLANWHTDGGIFSNLFGAVQVGIMGGGKDAPTEDEKAVERQVAGAQAKRAADEARAAGLDIAKGYAAGVRDGAPEIASAVQDSLGKGITAGNETLDRHSPSRVFGDMGEDTDLGYAKGVKDNAHVAADATAAMVDDSIDSARRKRMALTADQGGSVVASAGAGASTAQGGSMLNVESLVIQVQAPPGMSQAEARAVGEAAAEGLNAKVRAIMREERRDRLEFAGGLA